MQLSPLSNARTFEQLVVLKGGLQEVRRAEREVVSAGALQYEMEGRKDHIKLLSWTLA